MVVHHGLHVVEAFQDLENAVLLLRSRPRRLVWGPSVEPINIARAGTHWMSTKLRFHENKYYTCNAL
jgi:hypothetical protein